MVFLEETLDWLRNGFPYFLVLFLLSNPALAENFQIQKMIQYDLNQISYGCKGKTAINMEARPLNATYNFRNTILARMQDLTIDKFTEISQKAGGMIVLLPKTLVELSADQRDQILDLEKFMLDQPELSIPIYFLKYTEEFDKLIQEITYNQATSPSVTSALNDIVDKISANIYQVVVSGGSTSPRKDSKVTILQGELLPFKPAMSQPKEDSQNKLPIIVVNVGFKNFGIANLETPAYDSTIFLTLIDIFSKLYNQMSSAKYKLVFVMHEGSPLINYVGLRKWIDVATEDTHIQHADFAISLDTFGELSETIYMQVSKPPKEGGATAKFLEILEKKAKLNGRKVEVSHQKINLQQAFNKWPHERFSLKRMNGFTLSSVKDYNDPMRTTIFTENSRTSSVLESDSDLNEQMMENLVTNTKILAETLASYIFFNSDDDSGDEIFTEPLTITEKSLRPHLAPKSFSRSNNMKMTFDKFLKNVKVMTEKPDQREPEFMFYDGDEATLNVYNVKPAIFDLFMTLAIAAYLYAIYLVIIFFPNVYGFFQKFHSNTPTTNGVNKKSH